jgi:hypothetical protein
MLLVAAACANAASAKPRHATFEEALRQCPTVVVAKLLDEPEWGDHTATLEVVRVLAGDMKPGRWHVAFWDSPRDIPKGAEFVAFLDTDRVWRFVASPIGGAKTVDGAVLAMRGFYDYNEYSVSPGLTSERQLKAYLKDGSLTYRFRGAVYFPQEGKAGWKAGSLTIAGSYDAARNIAKVQGLPKLEGFPAEPTVYVHSDEWETGANVDVDYSRHGNRPLELMGIVDGLDRKSGDMIVRFAVKRPEILTEKAFTDYLGDQDKGDCYSQFKLKCVPSGAKPMPRELTLTVGRWSGDDRGGIEIEGWDKEPLKVFAMAYCRPDVRSGSVSLPLDNAIPKSVHQEMSRVDGVCRLAARAQSGECIILAFDPDGPLKGKSEFRWTFRSDLTYLIYSKELKGSVIQHDGTTPKTIASFTTTFGAVGFNRIEQK